MTELSPVTQGLLDAAAARIRGYARQTVEGYVSIGRELAMVHSVLADERRFAEWLRCEFKWSRRTAYSMMDAARAAPAFADCKDSAHAKIDLHALVLLGRRSTPAELVHKARDEIRQGKPVTHRKVRDWLELVDPEDDEDQEKPVGTAEVIDKLRDIDMIDEDPHDVVQRVAYHLRPLLADKARSLAAWLEQFAAALEAAG